MRGRGRVLEAVVVVLGLAYACFYTALDVLAGIGAGQETVAVGPGPWVSALFAMADELAVPGVHAYLAVAVIGGVTAVVVAVSPLIPNFIRALSDTRYQLVIRANPNRPRLAPASSRT